MRLHFFPIAPNPTKVRSYLAEKGLVLEQVRVDLLKGEQRTPEFRAKNPLGRLPVLELDSGECIAESLPIIEYLEELNPEPPMLGRTPLERLRVRSAERMIDAGVLYGIAWMVHGTRSPLGFPPRPEVAAWGRARLDETLPQVEGRLAQAPFVCGERPTVADCTLWAGLAFGRAFGIEPQAGFPALARWLEAFAARPGGRV